MASSSIRNLHIRSGGSVVRGPPPAVRRSAARVERVHPSRPRLPRFGLPLDGRRAVRRAGRSRPLHGYVPVLYTVMSPSFNRLWRTRAGRGHDVGSVRRHAGGLGGGVSNQRDYSDATRLGRDSTCFSASIRIMTRRRPGNQRPIRARLPRQRGGLGYATGPSRVALKASFGRAVAYSPDHRSIPHTHPAWPSTLLGSFCGSHLQAAGPSRIARTIRHRRAIPHTQAWLS